MASRREELNAYTFAKKRLVAAFLQPSPARTDEGAPSPLRAVVPGLVVGALLMVGFGAWGMFKPRAPQGWDEPGSHVIVGSESATLYVVLKTGEKEQLHPVLNMSSARLLLDPDHFKVIKVDERTLDSGKIPHGPTLGIPFAPDRVPDAEEAGREKLWTVCQQPDQGGTPQTATFLFAERDAEKVRGKGRLRGGELLYVQGPAPQRIPYLVSPSGVRYPLDGGAKPELLQRALVRGAPQPVTQEWLDTLRPGKPIAFPTVPGQVGRPAGVDGLRGPANRVGMVLRAQTASGPQHYLVLQGKAVPISDFVARLLLYAPDTGVLGQKNQPLDVDAQSFTPAEREHFADRGWPRPAPHQVNVRENGEDRDTVCSVLLGTRPGGGTEVATWTGQDFPQETVDGGTSAYVTPGTGLLYRQVQADAKTGGLFLVTDTGLRYAVQTNTDSSASPAGSGDAGTDGSDDADGAAGSGADKVDQARIRLGYQDVEPMSIPLTWSRFLPTGPRLDTQSARQPQGA